MRNGGGMTKCYEAPPKPEVSENEKKAVEACRKKAARSLLRFAGRRLPVRHADADEPRDEVTVNGFSIVQEFPAEEPSEISRDCSCDTCVTLRRFMLSET